MDSATERDIASILAEVGCADDHIAELSQIARVSGPDALVCRLAGLRADLVRRMHESEQKVDALDLLIFRLRQRSSQQPFQQQSKR